MKRIWLSFPLEESADATRFYDRALAFAFAAPEPKNPDLLPDEHPNRDRYFVPLLIQEFPGEAFEQQAKLISGHANTMPAPEFLLRAPAYRPDDDSEWSSLETWLVTRNNLGLNMKLLLMLFFESVQVIATVSSQVARMTASQRAQLILDNWSKGDQGFRRANFVVNKNPTPTYWQEVGDSESTRENLTRSGREWVVFGPGLLVRFSDVPTKDEQARILRDAKQSAPTNRPAPPSSKPDTSTQLGPAPTRSELKKLNISELRQAYVSIVGRPTKSTNRDYLLWKIGQVVKGKITAGTRKKSPSQGALTRRAAPKVTEGHRASRQTPPTLASPPDSRSTFKTVWAEINFRGLDKAEIKSIQTRVRVSGLEVDDRQSHRIFLNSGVPVRVPQERESVGVRARRAAEWATNVAMGRAQAMPLPSFLKKHEFRHMQAPKGFEPVSSYATGAWFLEQSLFEELKSVPADTREIVYMYLKRMSDAEKDVGMEDRDQALAFLLQHWDRGDVGCGEELQRYIAQPTYFSLPVTDIEATEIRVGIGKGRRLDENTFLFQMKLDDPGKTLDEKAMKDAYDLAEGFRVIWGVPYELEELSLTDLAETDDGLWTHPNTDARVVELAVLKRGGMKKKLIRLYLREISKVQKQYGIDGTGEATLAFVRENWELGDVGAGRKYADAVLAEMQVLLPKRPNRKRGGQREEDSSGTQRDVGPRRLASTSSLDRTNLDARLTALESRLQRRR